MTFYAMRVARAVEMTERSEIITVLDARKRPKSERGWAATTLDGNPV